MSRTVNTNLSVSQCAPRIMRAAGIAAKLYSRSGGRMTTGAKALAWLGEVSSAQASKWINQQQPVPLTRAILIEINSGHRIRAEDLLSEEHAFCLIKLRLAPRPKQQELEAWAELSANNDDRQRWKSLIRADAQRNWPHIRKQPRPRGIVRSILADHPAQKRGTTSTFLDLAG
ncbi:hypothetical protein ACMHYO_11335 [Allopusillimonas ginsengisoli]|uniref:hypothetical protein n=1 Tax=Allopusillimonas ginsengisoli TaxID=453575 RepID=UPI0039C20158